MWLQALLVAGILASSSTSPTPAPTTPTTHTADVVVYGATPAGCVAAVQLARLGRSVLLVNPMATLGGMMSGGLGWTDTGPEPDSVIGGLAREVFQRICAQLPAHDPRHRQWPERHTGSSRHPTPPRNATACYHFTGSAALAAFTALVGEHGANITVFPSTRLTTATKSTASLTTVSTASGAKVAQQTFAARVFIDATYEGDLLALGGVSYTIGREAAATYGEQPIGGVLAEDPPPWPNSQLSQDVSPYDAPGVLSPLVYGGPVGAPGAGDAKVQAYNFRFCLTTDADRIPLARHVPATYNASTFRLLARYIAALPNTTSVHSFFIFNTVQAHPYRTDINNGGGISTDFLGASWEYPNATWERRDAIVKAHRDYTFSLMHFLATSPSVPPRIRSGMAALGLCPDQWPASGYFPDQVYVREGRRMVSDFVFTLHDRIANRSKADSIGVGAYNIDAHHAERIDVGGKARNEGCISGYKPAHAPPFQIPYRALLPPRGQATNLLVPVAVSASHVGFGCLRLEPQFMEMGQAAAAAAHLALARPGAAVQDVAVPALQTLLRSAGAILEPA